MVSHAETFCRDRRLYDVKRGVVYLRRTDDLAYNQWRHYGAVPAIKTHVIREIGATTRLSDVTGFQHDTSDDQNLGETRASLSDVRRAERDVKSTESEKKTSDNDRNSKGHVREPPKHAGTVNHAKEVSKTRFSYKTRVLEESSSARPQISITEVTDRHQSATPKPASTTINPDKPSPDQNAVVSSSPTDRNTSVTTTASSVQGTVSLSWADSGGLHHDPREIQSFSDPLSTSKDFQHSLRESPHNAVAEVRQSSDGTVFNAWGSRDWEVERKLEPNLHPKSHAPKRYPPMSRAAGAGAGPGIDKAAGRRQIKTMTDFRSRNGTVRIIRPPAPIADLEMAPGPSPQQRAQQQEDDLDDLDVAALAREKTYFMLKRIDQLLEPNKVFFPSDLHSSEREVCSSATLTLSTSDLAESLPRGDEDGPLSSPGKSKDARDSDDRVYVHDKEAFLELFGQGHCDQFQGEGHGEDLVKGRGQKTEDDTVADQGRGKYSERSRHGGVPVARGHSEPPRGGHSYDSFRQKYGDVHAYNPRLDWQLRQFYNGQLAGRPSGRGQSELLQQQQQQQQKQQQGSVRRTLQMEDRDQLFSHVPGEVSPGYRRPKTLPPLQTLSKSVLGEPQGMSSSHPQKQHLHNHSLQSRHHHGQVQEHFDRGGPRGGGYARMARGGKRGKGWAEREGKGKAGWIGASLSEVVAKLEKGGVDFYLKCQEWVDISFKEESGTDV